MAVVPTTTVGQLVVERPGRSAVLERLGIDYCCGGKLPLVDACARKGLDPNLVIDAIARSDAESDASPGGEDPVTLSLAALADHIEDHHHRRLREELPRILRLADKVAAAHGERDPRLLRVREVAAAFAEEMVDHMEKEERVLFPAIRALESGCLESAWGRAIPSLREPVAAMEAEHEQGGDRLGELRRLTDGFSPPPDACGTYRALLDALAELERDTHRHVHKENSILFPKALALESPVSEGSR